MIRQHVQGSPPGVAMPLIRAAFHADTTDSPTGRENFMAAPKPRPTGESDGLTPFRRQYLQLKRRYPGTIVLFRLGDFYEAFDDDAKLISSELGIVLTGRDATRGQRIPMAGVPYHALDSYLARL